MKKLLIKNLDGSLHWSKRFDTEELASEFNDKIELKEKPWGHFPARDILKSAATEYDLTLVDSEYEVVLEEGYVKEILDSQGDPTGITEFIEPVKEIRVKLHKDYVVEIVDVSIEYEAEQVFTNRKKEYGPIQDQLDEIFHSIDAWRVRIEAVKVKYPKK